MEFKAGLAASLPLEDSLAGSSRSDWEAVPSMVIGAPGLVDELVGTRV